MGLLAMLRTLLLLLLPLAAQGQAAKAKKVLVTPEEKQAAMAEMYARVGHHGVITLSDQNYRYYATDKPRPYHIVALFTATASKYQCSKCSEVDGEFSLAAESYFKKAKPQDSPLFFVRVDFDTSKKTFQDYDFKGVPIIIHMSPYAERPFEVDARDRFAMHGVVDAESIAKFVTGRTGIEIEVYRSPYGVIVLMLILLGMLALSAKYLINLLPFILRKVQNKWLWVVASGIMYTCSISGLVFDIIRNPPPFYMDPRSGSIMFFHPQSGQQFVVEGFVIGALNILCAVCVIVMVEFCVSNRIKDENQRRNLAVGCVVGFAVFFYQIFSFYRMKNRWYMRV